MKQFNFLIFILLFISFCGCGNDDDDVSPDNLALGTITAKINGQSWSSATNIGGQSVSSAFAMYTFDYLILTGAEGLIVTGSDASSLSISILDAESSNSFSLGSVDGSWATFSTFVNGNSDATFTTNEDNTGSVSIEELTAESVKGTFEFRALSLEGEVVGVTEGAFNVPIN